MDEDKEDAIVELVGDIWRAMDHGLDEIEIRDCVDQAIQTWEPDSE